MPTRILEKKRDDGSVIYRIDHRTRKGKYYLNDDGRGQSKFLTEIEIDGFRDLPSGLYQNGWGMTGSGYYLLDQLHEQYGDALKVILSATSPSASRRSGKARRVTINQNDLKRINEVVKDIKHERKQEINGQVAQFLATTFPDEFDADEQKFSAYRPGTLARLLEDSDVVENLSSKDRDALLEFYPQFVGGMEFSLRSAKNVRFITEGMEATRTVYLSKVVAEYEKKLRGSANEGVWQKFLREHILLLLNSYSVAIEKQSVDIDGKFPDFMLVDPYGYLDIYEIKKPQTTLLKYDKSRGNYYWDAEVCKAISQVENYVDQIAQNRLSIQEKVRKKKGVSVKIVRPRGYIIVGTRKQLKNEDMEEDFRVLNDSLKNIDLIFYDDLLDNIKALLARIQGDAKTKEDAA